MEEDHMARPVVFHGRPTRTLVFLCALLLLPPIAALAQTAELRGDDTDQLCARNAVLVVGVTSQRSGLLLAGRIDRDHLAVIGRAGDG